MAVFHQKSAVFLRLSFVLAGAIFGRVVLRLSAESTTSHVADDEAHGHADETNKADNYQDDSEGCCVVLNTLYDLVLAVSVDGYSVPDIREEIVAAISAESCALEVCFKNLKHRVVLGPLGSCDDTSVISALFETSCAKSVSDHAVCDFSREDLRIDVAGAFLCAQDFLTSLEDLVELIDHTTLKAAAFVKLINEH